MNGTALLTGIPQHDFGNTSPIKYVLHDVNGLRDTLKDAFGFKVEELKGKIEQSEFEQQLNKGEFIIMSVTLEKFVWSEINRIYHHML